MKNGIKKSGLSGNETKDLKTRKAVQARTDDKLNAKIDFLNNKLGINDTAIVTLAISELAAKYDYHE
jgi:hypothetical protein